MSMHKIESAIVDAMFQEEVSLDYDNFTLEELLIIHEYYVENHLKKNLDDFPLYVLLHLAYLSKASNSTERRIATQKYQERH